jgi:hypothetical protein
MELIRKLFLITTMFTFLMFSEAFSAWEGPKEIVGGSWGQGDQEFGLDQGDTSDSGPLLTVILADSKIVMSDQVNEREVIYDNNGTLLKVVPCYIYQGGQKIKNPEYSLYQYWNIQGYTREGNVWMKISNYLLKSPTGEVLKALTERPSELGEVKEKYLGPGKYKFTVKYPDKTWEIIREGPFSSQKYIRDLDGNLYGVGSNYVVRYDDQGKEVAKLTMPEAKLQGTGLPSNLPSDAEPPRPEVLEGYGSPVVAPNGDVYTWKRTPDKYYIIKWVWQ